MPKNNQIFPYEPYLKSFARELRKNMAHGEVLLWQKIRNRQLGYQFHRQVPIHNYIVDFYCHELLLAIEIDGSTHDHSEVAVHDLARQNELEELGIRFLRFEEKEVRREIQEVVEIIENWIEMNNSTHDTPHDQR